ncbi:MULTISPECIES: carbohydrate ABC transporter permease [unclassified Oceanispirochaeta]|uniref:carbohydrate ABC transporter permease n=1 Tax=unclassified Oceanispirochaeta TaxID=2635722 RepID=UPI000E0975A6|nr:MULTISPECIES: carbohydrate ABC transporter permease [unclassified Oceanispirochaeta]MBF9017437.1 carbohydrate ABC transporter permease [Oceanispirochaeta sp. M2]NPD74009.1 carbohydrate ABC transporter permease [Oceanispirochaeta sp. M1]RDG30181.1 carbohydrate ABC transporter permease [Oceanispirochaeta sp. M1]
MVKNKKIKQLKSDRFFDLVNSIFLGFCVLLVSYPLIYILSASISDHRAVVSGKVWFFPVGFDLTAYKAVFSNKMILSGYSNSIFYMIVGTALSVFLTILAAFPLSRKEFYGRNIFMGIFLFTMLFSGGLIPTYLVVQKLGIIDTRLAMVLPNAMGIWNVIVTRTYLKSTISDELYEAAQLEGCSDIKFLFSFVIPLSGPIIAVMSLYYAVWIWNAYFDALIYLKSRELFPLQIVLRNILILNQTDGGMVKDISVMARKQGLADVLKYALIVVSSAPLLIIYPFVQKHFVKGIMIGSVKG